MPTVDPKPKHRPFRRVLYREDSKDSTVMKDVSPRNGGHLVTKSNKIVKRPANGDKPKMKMTNASRKLLMKEGILYKSPIEQIKYVRRVRNDRMGRYLFYMQQYNNSRLAVHSHRENQNLPMRKMRQRLFDNKQRKHDF